MFFSVNGSGFRKKHPELEKFVLCPRSRFLPPRFRIFCYFTVSPFLRYYGQQVVMKDYGHTIIIPFAQDTVILSDKVGCKQTDTAKTSQKDLGNMP
jgi:hypothetical protein